MTYRRFKHEALLYSLAFLVAVGMRFIQLGAMPLTDAEAAPALQALHISQSAPTPLDPHPFYILSTSLAFLLYGGGTNFLARFFPALVGSFLVLAPLLFDGRIKPRPGLLLAFFIALDPGLIAISRQAASPIFAIAFFVLTLGFLNRNNLSLAAFFAALTLLSGPSVWLGVLGFGIAWAIFQLFNRRVPSADEQSSEGEKVSAESEARPFTVNIQPAIWILFAASFLAAGTLFLTVPDGLGAAFASIPAFVGKWTQGSNLTPLIVAMSLVIYQPLALLLAVIASIRGWVKGSPRIIFLSVWLLVSLLLVVFLPARQMSDLVWTLIPMLILAALEFARHFNIYADERREVLGVIFLTAFIWAFAWLGFAGLTWFPPESREYLIRFWMLIGSLVLLVLSLLLVAAGWSTRTARIGGVWGLAIALGSLGLGGALGAAGLRGMNSPELWWQTSIPVQAELLRDSVDQLSEFATGDDNTSEVVIVRVKSPALEWVLRDHPIEVVETLSVTSAPDFVITPFEMDPALVSAYRGQDFSWNQNVMWDTASSSIWFRWATLREMPQVGDTIILWARDDLFIDN